MSYQEIEIDYDKDGEIEVEYDEHDPERGHRSERGQEILHDLDRTHVLDGFGR